MSLRGLDMLDIERIRDKLDELQRYLEELEEDLPPTKEEYRNNRTIRRACERTFQLASEDLLDVCNIIISEKLLPIPKDNKDSILKLEEAGIISRELSAKLQEMVGFRNLLVHRYVKVDDSRVYEYLRNEIADLYEFIEVIEEAIQSSDS